MSGGQFPRLVYLDYGSILIADDDGMPPEELDDAEAVADLLGDPEQQDRFGELFASAPELLECLAAAVANSDRVIAELGVERDPHLETLVERSRAAINRATGAAS